MRDPLVPIIVTVYVWDDVELTVSVDLADPLVGTAIIV